MAILSATPLEQRRQEIAHNFAKKILKHPEHRSIFKFTENNKTRSGKRVVVPVTRIAEQQGMKGQQFLPWLSS